MHIEIAGAPIAKARHRSFIRNKTISSYDPQVDMKKRVKLLMKIRKQECDGDHFFVFMDFFMPIPASFSKKKREEYEGRVHSNKPDIDNLAKFYLDCANKILWNDDSQVVCLQLNKYYSENPRTVIKISGAKKA